VDTRAGILPSPTCCAIFVQHPCPPFEVRFETPPGDQAQVDFAQFQLQFTDEPTITRIVWLFSFVLGFSRLTWARFVAQTIWFSAGHEIRCNQMNVEGVDIFHAQTIRGTAKIPAQLRYCAEVRL
jgi:hypothetical protein